MTLRQHQFSKRQYFLFFSNRITETVF
uniref:Uncharacterized protein n=1 Tax=Arundo donax TaxID=35708 RepID=A0A0A8YX05_ARUDO